MQLEAGALPVGVAGPSLPAPRRAWRRTRVLLGSGGARVGAAILLVVGLCAVAPGWLAPADPNEQNLLARFTRPGARAADGTLAVLGTDQLGRDILSRVVHGAKTSVLIGLSAVLVAGALGTGLGLVAGMRGGAWDHVIMRLADMQFAFPFILLAITVIGVLGASVRNIILVVGLSNWCAYARVVRAETLATREKAFVDAARALGVPLGSIVRRHVLPNVSASLIVVATFGVAGAILTEAGLSFLGLGVPLAIPSWGGMLAEGRQFIDTRYWLALFPGAALFATVMGINLVGDALRDALDPYLQTRHTRSSVDRLYERRPSMTRPETTPRPRRLRRGSSGPSRSPPSSRRRRGRPPAQPKPVVVVQSGEAATLDWHMHCDKNAHEPDRQIFDTLLRRNLKTLQLEGNLAESWRLVNDTTWQFKLRRNVKFHNGEPFDAAAVKFSIERMLNPQQAAPGRTSIATIDHVDVVDPPDGQRHHQDALPAPARADEPGALRHRRHRAAEVPGAGRRRRLRRQARRDRALQVRRVGEGRPARAGGLQGLPSRAGRDRPAGLPADPRAHDARGRAPVRPGGPRERRAAGPGRQGAGERRGPRRRSRRWAASSSC